MYRTGTDAAATDNADSVGYGFREQGMGVLSGPGARRGVEEQRFRSWRLRNKNAIVAELKTGHKMRPGGITVIR